MLHDPLIQSITPDTSWYVVIRPFQGDTGSMIRGEVVDASSWLHRTRLEELRYIAPLPYGAEVPTPDATGRRIVNPDAKQAVLVPQVVPPTQQAEATATDAKGRPIPSRKA